MKILMISSDPEILRKGSQAAKRFDEYRGMVEALYPIVIAGSHNMSGFFRAWREGSRILKQTGVANFLITSQDPFERGLVAWLLARRFGVPLELQVHTDMFSPWFWRESIKNKIRVMLARWLLPRATTIRVVSERIKQSLIERLVIQEKHIMVLPISEVTLRNEVTNRNDNVFTFLMVSRLTREKNIPLALRAFRGIVETHPQARLIIVGSGPEEKRLKFFVFKFQIPNSNIKFFGWQDDLEPYWRQADAYLLTSNYEGYGRTVVDALRHRVPVVMTDVGVAGEIVKNGENGFFVPVGDEEMVAEAMKKVMTQGLHVIPPALISHDEYRKRMKAHWEYALTRFNMPKLVYILPEYHPDIGTHFYYLGGFIKHISRNMDVAVIEEKHQRVRLLPHLAWLRLRGYKNFYVHYSFYGAFMSIIATTLLGGRVWYWNCGMPWLYQKDRSWFEEHFFRFILRNTILVTGTPGITEQYRNHYGLREDRVRVMPNWIDLTAYRNLPSQKEARNILGIPQKKKVALFVHRLSKRKGAHRIAAIADVMRDIPDMLFLIVGSGPEEQSHKSQVKSQKLGDIVQFEGSIPARRIPLYMRAADVFFMPSDEEGFPHVLLEAMASGTPFVVSRVGGVAEIIPESMKYSLCKPDDIKCFAGNMREIFSHSGHDIEELKHFVERYDMVRVGEQFRTLFISQ
jgi:glycosyltransferase involved in cell wall biosynthesis